MKKEFYALKTYDGKKELVKQEGDYDSKYGVYYLKEDKYWKAVDSYSGASIVIKKATKKECQESLKAVYKQVEMVRNGEKFLQSVVNYNEMLEDVQ